MKKKVYAVILAGGIGKRMSLDSPKQFMDIGNKTILEHSVEAFEKSDLVNELILVINPEHKEYAERLISERGYKKTNKVINGGKTRQKSSYNGLCAIDDNESFVLIHDAARPFVSQEIITDCIDNLDDYDAVVPITEITDTIGEIDSSGKIVNIPRRQFIRKIQTPQAFRTSVIKTAHEMFNNSDSTEATDDCMLVLRFRLGDVHTVSGSVNNIKITRPGDIDIAERIYELSRKID